MRFIIFLFILKFTSAEFYDAFKNEAVFNTIRELYSIDEFSSKDTFYCLYRCSSMPTCLSVETTEIDKGKYHCTLMNSSALNALSYQVGSDLYRKRVTKNCTSNQHLNTSVFNDLPSPPWFFNAFSNIFYAVKMESKDFSTAQNWCRSYGGNLFTVVTECDLELLQHVYNSQIKRNFLIGAYAFVGKDFRWILNNGSLSSIHWCSGEPNGGQTGEPCVVAGKCNSYKYNDVSCNDAFPFLCEKRL